MSYTAFAEKCGLKEHHIRRIMEGAIPNFDTISAIHKATGLNLHVLIEDSPIWDKEFGLPIQVTGKTGLKNAGAYVGFKEGENRGFIEVSGSDMSPKFNPGDFAVIKKGLPLEHDGFAVCETEEAVLLRKVCLEGNNPIFYALNAEEERPFSMESGKVVSAFKVVMKIEKF